jgi:hypothetical protein
MRISITKAEGLLLLAGMALLLAALFAPALAQPGHAHDFADQRSLWGIPCALDVLSNFAFLLAGLAGFFALRGARAAGVTCAQRITAELFFIGLVVTAIASSWYHWAPNEVGLALDRHAMAIAFAGLLGLVVATQIGERAGLAMAAAVVLLGTASIQVCLHTGNVLPWALLQFGGMGLVLVLAFRPTQGGMLHVRWGWVIAAYAMAKLFEAADHVVFEATGQWVAGHTVKHVVAAFAAWPVFSALRAVTRSRQNAKQIPAAAALRNTRHA